MTKETQDENTARLRQQYSEIGSQLQALEITALEKLTEVLESESAVTLFAAVAKLSEDTMAGSQARGAFMNFEHAISYLKSVTATLAKVSDNSPAVL
jgi:hypothetical protein